MREGLKDQISGTSQNDSSVQKYTVDNLLSIIHRIDVVVCVKAERDGVGSVRGIKREQLSLILFSLLPTRCNQ